MYGGTGRGEEYAPGQGGGGALGPAPQGAGPRPPVGVPPWRPPWEVHSLSAPFGLPAAAPRVNQACPAGWGPRLHDLMALSLIVAAGLLAHRRVLEPRLAQGVGGVVPRLLAAGPP